MASGIGAGLGAEMLQEVLRRKLAEDEVSRRSALDQQRMKLEQQRLNDERSYRDASLASMDSQRQAQAKLAAQQTADRLASTLIPGAALDAGAIQKLQEGDLGSLVEHKDATLGSRNLAGGAVAGQAPRILGLASSANPGQAARDNFTGTAAQQRAEQMRQDSVSAREAAAADRKAAAEEQRAFQEQMAKAQRDFQGSENAANRANTRAIAGLRIASTQPNQTAQQNEVADTVALIDQIQKDPSLAHAVGPMDQYAGGIINADPTGVNRFKALHDQLVGKMSLAQAGKLKGQGQISDKERAMLAAAATALNRGLSEQDYLAELGKVRDQFVRMQQGGGGPVPAPSVAPRAAATSGVKRVRYDMNGNPIKD